LHLFKITPIFFSFISNKKRELNTSKFYARNSKKRIEKEKKTRKEERMTDSKKKIKEERERGEQGGREGDKRESV
jgi:hypothetical protein